MPNCATCGGSIPDGARFCPTCGERFDGRFDAPPAPEPTRETRRVVNLVAVQIEALADRLQLPTTADPNRPPT